jgi:L-lactate dehydrogenase complex protein LldF
MKQPFNFDEASTAAAHDEVQKTAVSKAVGHQYAERQKILHELPDADALRTLAGEIKQHAIDNLDFYLEQLKAAVERNGGKFHLVATPEEAVRRILEIAANADCHRVIKSKSMVSEEIGLAHEMEARGMDVVETDLGEFIVQISHDTPSHIVAPIVHLKREAVAKLISKHFNIEYNDDPTFITRHVRKYLREKFRTSDFGMTGANFLVAETGQVCAVENEGNQRQSFTTPRVLVTLAGIEKIVPRLADLSVMLKLLARSATGQHMTIYTNIFGGPRKDEEKDGPKEFHLVLLDGGRTEILGGKYRETLRCIRCGACLNACPVYRKIGGHSYGNVYSGPIGALVTPLMNGLEKNKDLPQASSLCGACYEACPVKINIPEHLISLRQDIVTERLNSPLERIFYRVWAWGMRSPLMYAVIGWFQKLDLRRRARKTGWISRLPKLASGWTQVRDMPPPAKKTFHQMWKNKR